ncbi:adenylate kinase [Dehalogenimonas etheniformans]|uniref:Adenylate kinase n=1 Tax=Dehalogenimonas etheniformans TaxID=1536648 RepID=A0A2P5P7L3_9CHLR|nr:adenylate kinase [Dehalogenimonas etheniformans]PPD58275.1 adenylate kinase [Dehalogenimonas etheniformans]QNT75684.1 adenylate kinase [Dehalogenimonas etheniformans]
MYNIVFLGAPGAGKGTQAAVVAEKMGMAHVATGDLFRKHIASGDELGREVKSYLDKGQLVPDEVTVAMVLNRIGQLSAVKGVILDGFPRTLAQAEALDKALKKTGEKVGRVIYFAVPETELVKRLSDRWICRGCQAPYTAADRSASEKCRKCGGELYQRTDDTPETVQKRLTVYFKETAPLIEYYRKARSLVEVNGTGEVEAITGRVVAALKKA